MLPPSRSTPVALGLISLEALKDKMSRLAETQIDIACSQMLPRMDAKRVFFHIFPSPRFDANALDCYYLIAGWSSLVARWAHNPKVASSNLAPATKNSHKTKQLRGAAKAALSFVAEMSVFCPRMSCEDVLRVSYDTMSFVLRPALLAGT